MERIKKRKQHYVPRFYLKYFGIEPEYNTIGIWNIRRKLFIPKGKLKNQAYKDFFYGKDGLLEDALSLLETEVSRVTRKIISDLKLPKTKSIDRISLYTFLIFQASRTEAAVQDLEFTIDRLTQLAFKNDRRVKDFLPYLRIGLQNPAAMQLNITAKFAPLIFDLNLKLFINKTRHEFVTSDNPVVSYNQLVEYLRWPGSGTGWGMMGLQIFFPLTPRLMLVLYDSDVYRVGKFYSRRAIISNAADINRLNGLQFIS